MIVHGEDTNKQGHPPQGRKKCSPFPFDDIKGYTFNHTIAIYQHTADFPTENYVLLE